METFEKYQRELLQHSRRSCRKAPISQRTEQAFLALPRHLFVRRYRVWGATGWQQVTAETLEQHLPILYADKPLVLSGDDSDLLSTISQPSFVLRMLDLLQLEPGQTVFELGAGSGWNAALMGCLVAPKGHVYSLELIPEVAKAAEEAVLMAGITNVTIVNADGGDGYAPGAPYDRAIFTAGTYDLPLAFHDQIREGGILLAVIKLEGGGDMLYVMSKTNNRFESVESMYCGFVQLKGKHRVDGLEPADLNALLEWPELEKKIVARARFWWGGHGEESFMLHTQGIRFFLGISEPCFCTFKTIKTSKEPHEEHFFGLWDQAKCSQVLARGNWIITYGNAAAGRQLLKRVRQWVDLGMPTAASFKLQVYPNDFPVHAGGNQWIVKRRESTFLWSLDA
jgi:protein-L-isoaspartate(D-aspartate) O-methyltransferase